jgi:hypothetical protein
MPQRYPSSADTDAMITRIAPAVLALLGDGVPRRRRAIVTDARVECRRINGKLARIGDMLETLDAIVAKLGAPTVP